MVRQFDVFATPRSLRRLYPFMVVLQHDSIETTGSIIVAPLVSQSKVRPSRIHPAVALSAGKFVLVTPDLATVARASRGTPVANLAEGRDQIVAAIDLLFVGS